MESSETGIPTEPGDADPSPAAAPAADRRTWAVTFVALLAATAAAMVWAAPLDRIRRWSTPGLPAQELVFTLLLGALLAFTLLAFVSGCLAYRRFPHSLAALSLVLAPAHVALLASMLAVGWYGGLPAADTERLMAAAWVSARLLLAAGIALGVARQWLGAEARSTSGFWRPVVRAILGLLGALLLLAAVGRLPWSPGQLLGRIGWAAVLVDVTTLVPLLLPAVRRSPSPPPYLVSNTVARLLVDTATALAGGLRDDFFMFAQVAALASAGAVVLGISRAGRAELELGRAARARVREVERELAKERSEIVSREVSGELNRHLLRDLQKAVEAMRIGLTVATPEGRIVYVNPAEAELHGWDRDELVGQLVTVYAPAPSPEKRPRGGPRPWLRVSENVTRQGERFPVRLHTDVVNDESGKVAAVVTLCEDIRDELRVEAALQRRERVLEALEVATERFLRGGLQPDHQAEVLEGLRRAAEVEGAHLTRLAPDGMGSPGEDHEPPGTDIDTALRSLGRRLPPGEPWVGKVADLGSDLGAPLLAAGVGSLACVPASVAGEPWALLSISSAAADREWSPIDVDALEIAARILSAAEENELARVALLASEARYRNLVESASDLIQSVDDEGRIHFVNEAWAAALGWSREEALGLTLRDVIDPRELDHCRKALGRVMAGEGQTSLQTTFRTRAGARLRVEGNAAVQLEGGRPVATLAILRNITESERLARMKDEFVAMVSHELRTPLTSMLGALSLLSGARLEEHPGRRRELTDVAVRNGERLLRLVNELLDLQKLEAGQLRMTTVACEVVELLEEAGNGVAALAESKGVRIHLASEPGLRVLCDRERIVQVLFNVLSNAIKFSPSGEDVLARARAAGGAVEIEVFDHGPGIPPDFRHQLFEPFAQADGGSTRSAGGSGLGLYISRQLVEAMAGAIRIEDGQDGGTRAVVSVPRVGATAGAAV